jgi:hypothetical protein
MRGVRGGLSGPSMARASAGNVQLRALRQGSLLLTVGGAVLLASAGPCPAAQMLSTDSGACIEVQGGNVADGTPIDVYQCTGSPNQVWTITNGVITGIGGSCLDVKGSASAAKAPIILVACNGRGSQQWAFANGQIVGIGGKCLTAGAITASNTAALTLSRCRAVANQLWLVQ